VDAWFWSAGAGDQVAWISGWRIWELWWHSGGGDGGGGETGGERIVVRGGGSGGGEEEGGGGDGDGQGGGFVVVEAQAGAPGEARRRPTRQASPRPRARLHRSVIARWIAHSCIEFPFAKKTIMPELQK
jgi:hypothetical protein